MLGHVFRQRFLSIFLSVHFCSQVSLSNSSQNYRKLKGVQRNSRNLCRGESIKCACSTLGKTTATPIDLAETGHSSEWDSHNYENSTANPSCGEGRCNQAPPSGKHDVGNQSRTLGIDMTHTLDSAPAYQKLSQKSQRYPPITMGGGHIGRSHS